MARQLGLQDRVLFLGYRRDVIEILHCADLYAHPSMREGLGIAALEAMASGLPLLASNVGGIPDYVKNGITGFSYEFDDVSGFAEGLERYYQNIQLRQTMTQNGLHAVKMYDIREVEQVVCRLMEFSGV